MGFSRKFFKVLGLLLSGGLLFTLKYFVGDSADIRMYTRSSSITLSAAAGPSDPITTTDPGMCPQVPVNTLTQPTVNKSQLLQVSKSLLQQPFLSCDWRSSGLGATSCTRRLRATISCRQTSADIVFETVPAPSPPAAYSFSDDCLRRVVSERCTEDEATRIPKLVHFVTFGGGELPFYSFLSVLSAARFGQPCLLLFHTDALPTGQYWDILLRLLPHIVHVNRSAPSAIFEHEVKVVEHKADIARLEAVKTFGGLYIDTDYLLLNPVDDLRNYTVVMGNTIPNYNYANGVFMGKAGSEFFDLWYDSYRTFDDKVWGFHSTIMPYNLHKQHPNVPFHAVDTFMRPWFKNIKKQFFDDPSFSWTNIHGIHLYVRLFKQYFVGDYETKNSSLGRVSRHILYGDENACF